MQHEQPMSLRERLARTLSFGPVRPRDLKATVC